MMVIIFYFGGVYTRLRHAILRHRTTFTESEVRYMIDIMDNWTEDYKLLATEARDDEVKGLHDDMSVAIEVRNKLWRQLND
jgi:hypothetical protein